MNTEKVNNYFNQGMLIIISSPSGAGKTTICQKIALKDRKIKLSISYTSRKKRKVETHGKHYKFISMKKFLHMKNKGLFLEYAKVFGNNYGTPIKDIRKNLKLGKDFLFDIDWQGANQIRKKFPKHVLDIFIMPPNISELRKRLISRGQDDIKVVDKRMKLAISEMHHFHEYRYVLFNNHLLNTIKKIKNIIHLERNLRKDLRSIKKILNN